AASHHECVGPFSPAVGELHRPYRVRARDAVPIGLLLLEPVLAQDLVEGERLFLDVVLVIRLLDDRKRRDEVERNRIREQLPGKRSTRYLRETQLLDRLAR